MPVVVGPWNSNPGCPDGAIQEELRSCGVQLRRGDAKRFCDHSRWCRDFVPMSISGVL